jgi:hypothetical protein
VTLKESGRNVLVELAEGVAARAEDASRAKESEEAAPAPASAPQAPSGPSAPAGEPRAAEGIREIRRLFQSAQNPPRWPMYIRQAKQFLRNVDSSFDERRFGFASLVDLMRACQRDGLFRIERDRQGVMRIFPGNVMQAVSEPLTIEPDEAEESPRQETADGAPMADAEASAEEWRPEPGNMAEAEVVEAAVLQELESPGAVVDGETEPVEPASVRRRKPRPSRPPGARKTEVASAPRARKTASRPRTAKPRARKDTPSE